MRLLRRNIIAHPHNKNTNMKIERDILYISIEKNNFLSNINILISCQTHLT